MDLVCWWCIYKLDLGPCYHLPVKYDEKKNIFYTKGNFCSWECAKAWAVDSNNARWAEHTSLLALMRLRAYGKSIPVFPAPRREHLKIFGGKMTHEEFRACFGKLGPPLSWPNEHVIQPIIGGAAIEATVAKTEVSRSKLKQIEESAVENSSFKLKRQKPLSRDKSKLEMALGITRK